MNPNEIVTGQHLDLNSQELSFPPMETKQTGRLEGGARQGLEGTVSGFDRRLDPKNQK